VRFGDPECQVSHPSPTSSVHFCILTGQEVQQILIVKNKISTNISCHVNPV